MKNMDFQNFASLISDIKFCMLTTVNDDGSMNSRPMATLKIDKNTFDGTLWFFTKKDSAKVHSIEHDDHVNLAYVDPDEQKYISVAGRAFLITDKEKMKELWNTLFMAFFPDGLKD